jgi:2-keto-3-deoxy-L-rhamnonate aldolase RhmA
MAENKLKERWKAGKAAVNGWLAIPSGFSAEVMAQCGWDSVTVDMQHGVQDYQTTVQCFQAMDRLPVTKLVRVPWNEPGIVGKVLDGGAYGRKRGIYPGIHCGEPAYAARMIRMGFRLTTIANDSGLMAKAAREAVAGVWQGVGEFR